MCLNTRRSKPGCIQMHSALDPKEIGMNDGRIPGQRTPSPEYVLLISEQLFAYRYINMLVS
jgi:hypothetical protein